MATGTFFKTGFLEDCSRCILSRRHIYIFEKRRLFCLMLPFSNLTFFYLEWQCRSSQVTTKPWRHVSSFTIVPIPQLASWKRNPTWTRYPTGSGTTRTQVSTGTGLVDLRFHRMLFAVYPSDSNGRIPVPVPHLIPVRYQFYCTWRGQLPDNLRLRFCY
jgi:hypothetical protein